MSYKFYKDLTINWSENNVLRDDHLSFKYADIPLIMEDLDAFFEEQNKYNIFCLGFEPKNTVIQSIIILYLITKRINFYIASSNLGTNREMPSFCDKIINVSPKYSASDGIGASIEIVANPNYHVQSSVLRPNSGAVLLSSSGTTGPAKFINFSTHDLLQNGRNVVERFNINYKSKILIPVPISHMYGIGVGLLPALLSGASICLIEKNNILKLFDNLIEYEPDITLLTPTVVKMMVLFNKSVPAKSFYITAGERIGEQLYEQFETKYNLLINLYGCTELGAIATSIPGDSHREDRRKGLLLPLTGIEVKVNGDTKGEILCKHNASFQYYLDKYGNTIQTGKGNSLWYNTKDAGLDTGQGSFSVIGRTDNCINRSGFLISLEEIEFTLQNMSNEINRAVVFSYEDEISIRTRLVAICELSDGSQLNCESIKIMCRERMNKYSLPDVFHLVDKIPKLPNGKPDRNLLITTYTQTFKN